MTAPLVAVPGRRSPEATGLRTPVVAGGRLYLDAIQRAGGLPVVVPPWEDDAAVAATIDRCDAMVLLGGGDVDPRSYGQTERARLYGVDASLDRFEIAAIRRAMERDLPVLAVCRGHQILNVALGGTLVQHLDNHADHRAVLHTVGVVAGSRVACSMGTTEPLVMSFHHQAVDRPAEGLRVVATAPDGTIEAVEHESLGWVVGVQWHPEDTAAEDPANQGLFDALIAAARK